MDSNVVKLDRAITDGAQTWDQLTLGVPQLRHRVEADRSAGAGAGENARTAALIAAISGVSESAIRRLAIRDARRIAKVLANTEYAEDAGVTDGLLTLLHPVPTEREPLKSVPVMEPTLEAGILAEKFKNDGEKTAAMIASCCGITMQMALRLSLVDVARIEAALRPFLLDGEMAPAEEAAELNEPAATTGG